MTDTVSAHVLSPDAAYVVREGAYTVNFKDGTSRRTYLVMTSIWTRENRSLEDGSPSRIESSPAMRLSGWPFRQRDAR